MYRQAVGKVEASSGFGAVRLPLRRREGDGCFASRPLGQHLTADLISCPPPSPPGRGHRIRERIAARETVEYAQRDALHAVVAEDLSRLTQTSRFLAFLL